MRLRIQDILDLNDVSYRLIELSDRAVSVNDVIEYSRACLDPREICKTIIVKMKTQFYALFLRGSDKIDFKKVRSTIGKSTIASKEDVLSITSVEPGAVCPLLVEFPVIVDKRLLELERLNFGSGHHLYGVEIRTDDLKKVLVYKVADIAA